MQHLRDLSLLSLESCELTIGSFDGVHRGHQRILQSMVEHAREAGVPSVVITFHPHPAAVLKKVVPFFYLTSPEEKADILGGYGAEYVVTQKFSRELSRVTAPQFLRNVLRRLKTRDLWIGEDFAFGHQREGDKGYLESAAEKLGFQLHVVPPVLLAGGVVSSTRIRQALASGEVSRVTEYLGRHYALEGEVVSGSERGKVLGFPTANLYIWEEKAIPGPGVYACTAEFDDSACRAVTNIGVRPTFDEGHATQVVEAHLLDFEGDLYGKSMKLMFVERLRDERRFESPEALMDQIEKDIRRAREVLGVVLEMNDG